MGLLRAAGLDTESIEGAPSRMADLTCPPPRSDCGVSVIDSAGSYLILTITCASRTSKRLDVFFVGHDGAIGSVAWEGGVNNNAWSDGFPVTKPGAVL